MAVIGGNSINYAFRPGLGTRALDTGLDFLSTAGHILDTPGSILRGLLRGDLERALGGIFNVKKRISGTELLGGKRDRFSWGGLGAEILLDPLTYLTFGASTAAGKLASRAGKLQDTLQGTKGLDVISDAAKARRASNEAALAEVFNKQKSLGRTAGERLAPTFAQQGKLGQRAGLSFDIPFTNINKPLTSGNLLLPALTKANVGLKAIPGTAATTRTLNTLFNPNYSKELGRVRNPVERAARNELKILTQREPEALGAIKQREIDTAIKGLMKQTGLDRATIESQLIDTLEGGGLKDLPATDPKYPGLIALKQRAEGVHPLVTEYGYKLRDMLNTLNKQAMNIGLEGAADLSGPIGYFGRVLTPKASKFISDAKKSGQPVDKVIQALIPKGSFTMRRKQFRDVPFNELNQLIRDKLKIDFDFFSPDVATNIGQRYKQQQQLVAQAKSIQPLMGIFGKGKDKGLRDIAGLYRDLASKRGRVISTKGVGPLSKYNVRALIDDQGNIVNRTTDEDVERTLGFLKQMRDKNKTALSKEDIAERLYSVVKNGLNSPSMMNIVKRFSFLQKYLKDIDPLVDDYTSMTDWLSTGPSISRIKKLVEAAGDDPGFLELGLKSKFDFKNTVYHGTTDKNIDAMFLTGKGMVAQPPKDIYRSSHLQVTKDGKPLPANFFTKKQSSASTYATDASTRFGVGGQEYGKKLKEGILEAVNSSEWAIMPFKDTTIKGVIEDILHKENLYNVNRTAAVKKYMDSLVPPDRITRENIINTVNSIESVYDRMETVRQLYPEIYAEILKEIPKSDVLGLNKTFDEIFNTVMKTIDIDSLRAEHTLKYEFKKEIARAVAAYSGSPNILKTKVSQLELFGKGFTPEYKDILNRAKEFTNYKTTELPPQIRERIKKTKHFEGLQDDFTESQLLHYGDVPPQLLKKYAGGPAEINEAAYVPLEKDKWKRVYGDVVNLGRENKDLRWSNTATKKQIGKIFDDAGIKDRYVDKGTYEDIKKFFTTPKDPEFAKGALRFLDGVNAVYRGALTVMFPAYHTRNFMSGAFMNVLAGMNNPQLYVQSVQELRNLSSVDKLKLEALGVIGKGLHEETYNMMMNSALGKKVMKYNPAYRAYSAGRKVGQGIDNVNRYALYLDGIKKGLSESEAAERVIKYHFDYSDLTDFEKLGARRAFLFYTFMRKNIPLMLESMVKNPRVMQAYNRSVGGTNDNIQQPDWLGDAFFAGYDKKGAITRLGMGLPPEDLRRFGTKGEGIQRFGQLLFGLLSPVITAPTELAFNKNLYYDKPLEGNLVERLLDVSPISRFTGTAERALKSPGREAVRFTTGINPRKFDPKEMNKQVKIQNLQKGLRQLAKKGRAREFSVYSSEDEEGKKLNSLLNKAYKN